MKYQFSARLLKNRINFKSLYFLSANVLTDTYRITIIANTTPITTITNAPTVPPIVTGKLFDGEE